MAAKNSVLRNIWRVHHQIKERFFQIFHELHDWENKDFSKSIQSWPPCRVGRLRWQMRGRVNQRSESSWNLPRVILGKRYTAQSANNPSWFQRMIFINLWNAFQVKVFDNCCAKDRSSQRNISANICRRQMAGRKMCSWKMSHHPTSMTSVTALESPIWLGLFEIWQEQSKDCNTIQFCMSYICCCQTN